MVQVSQVHLLDRAWVEFDDERLVANAGLGLPALLMQRLGLMALANVAITRGFLPGRKVATIVAGMLAGGDSIDDLNVLRAGDTGDALDFRVMAPSTIGTFLRSLTIGQIKQVDRVCGVMFERAWQAGAAPAADDVVVADIDSSVHEVYGELKEGASWAYNDTFGLHPQYATIRHSGEFVATRLREGSANSARSAASFVSEAVNRIRRAGHTGPIEVAADSAFHVLGVIERCEQLAVTYSITARRHKDGVLDDLIGSIPEHAWRSIEYKGGVAQVAESYHSPLGRGRQRLIVRRVRNRDKREGQGQLFDTWQYHAFVTNKPGAAIELDGEHRKRATQELAIRELKENALAHMPSGKFAANAAWVALGALAHNIIRWVSRIGLDFRGLVTMATLRRKLLVIPGRIVRSARRTTLRMPARWPWADEYVHALRRIRALPQPK